MISIVFNPHNDHTCTDIALCAGYTIRSQGLSTYYQSVYADTADKPIKGDIEMHITSTISRSGLITITGPDDDLNERLQKHVSSVLRYPTKIVKDYDNSIQIDFMKPDINNEERAQRIKRNVGTKIGEGFMDYIDFTGLSIDPDDYCDICGAGPFKNVNLHKARVH